MENMDFLSPASFSFARLARPIANIFVFVFAAAPICPLVVATTTSVWKIPVDISGERPTHGQATRLQISGGIFLFINHVCFACVIPNPTVTYLIKKHK